MRTYKFEDLEKAFSILAPATCPSCGLMGELKACPKCGRDACDKCVAVDNTDCMFCGPGGDIAKEVFKPMHERDKHGTRDA